MGVGTGLLNRKKKKSQSRKCRQIMEYEMHFAIQYEALKDITTENI